MTRHLVLFAREPGRAAEEKGFSRNEARDFFALLAEQWRRAASSVGAHLVVASPPEDRLAWQRCFGRDLSHHWVGQRGTSFGERLESAARAAAALGGHAVIVGGDVVPSALALEEAFTAREAGVDAVLAPAPDGGVSLLALGTADLDLLRGIAPRRADVFEVLRGRLLARRRRVCVLAPAPDVDGRGGLRVLLSSESGEHCLQAMARHALARPDPFPGDSASCRHAIGDRGPTSLRGPPPAL